MSFNVNIAFDDLKNSKGKSYAIQISDTVIIKQEGVDNIVSTGAAVKEFKKISFTLNESDESEDDDSNSESEVSRQQNNEPSSSKGTRYNTRSSRSVNKQKAIEA